MAPKFGGRLLVAEEALVAPDWAQEDGSCPG
jgi:hypothetical protein